MVFSCLPGASLVPPRLTHSAFPVPNSVAISVGQVWLALEAQDPTAAKGTAEEGGDQKADDLLVDQKRGRTELSWEVASYGGFRVDTKTQMSFGWGSKIVPPNIWGRRCAIYSQSPKPNTLRHGGSSEVSIAPVPSVV